MHAPQSQASQSQASRSFLPINEESRRLVRAAVRAASPDAHPDAVRAIAAASEHASHSILAGDPSHPDTVIYGPRDAAIMTVHAVRLATRLQEKIEQRHQSQPNQEEDFFAAVSDLPARLNPTG